MKKNRISQLFPAGPSRGRLMMGFFLSALLISACGSDLRSVRSENKDEAVHHRGGGEKLDPEEFRRFQEKIDQAVAAARKSGQSEVNVYLDEKPDEVQPGDLALVQFRATLESGELVYSTREADYRLLEPAPAGSFRRPVQFVPEAVLAGEKSGVPGVGEAAVGLRAGEIKTVTFPPDKAFGTPNPEKIKKFDRIHTIPLAFPMRPLEFVKQTERFPVVGSIVNLHPYFPSRIAEVHESYVMVEHLPEDGAQVREPYGTASVRVIGDQIEVMLTPQAGAAFTAGEQRGRIVDFDDRQFTVDFNSSLAGRSVVLELELVSLTKASRLHGLEISWIEDYDTGLQQAAGLNKPMLLVLYARWCKWSEKLLQESMKDPRVRILRDRFIWVKVDSDAQREFMEAFDQESFPMVLVISADGDVVYQKEGHCSPAELSAVLRNALKTENTAGASRTPDV